MSSVNPMDVFPKTEQHDRRIEHEWALGEPVRDGETTTQTFAVLCVSSLHPERKGYYATLRQETEEKRDGSPFSSRGFMLFGGESILAQATPRFKQGDLEAVAGAAMEELKRRYLNGDEAVTKFFTTADELVTA